MVNAVVSLGKTGANHGLASDILSLARSDDVADDDFIHGDFFEIVCPLGILLFNGAKSFVLCRIRRVIFSIGR